MLLVILVVFFIALIIFEYPNNYHFDSGNGFLCIIFMCITLFYIIVNICTVVDASVIDEKIALYEESNEVIESELDLLVKNYMNYESDTLSQFKSESSTTLVTMFPELKADTLVQQQLNTYKENTAIIRQLKEEQLKASVAKWWLYFGH